MIRSMTGYAERRGAGLGHEWRWELRSVNGRGLDLRLRVPDWIEGLEAAARAALQGAASRGSVTASLRAARVEGAAGARAIDGDALASALALMASAQRAAAEAGLTLAPVTAADVLGVPGVVREAREDADAAGLREAVLADLGPAVEAWSAMRAAEGARLAQALAARLDRIEALVAEAERAAADRADGQAAALGRSVEALLGRGAADPDRLAQELALIAVRSDVSEEIDRLRAHVAAARDLLCAVPAGRRLDFLAQEFAREANTLCSKAQSSALTAVGLDLKTVVDQLREQVQNVE